MFPTNKMKDSDRYVELFLALINKGQGLVTNCMFAASLQMQEREKRN